MRKPADAIKRMIEDAFREFLANGIPADRLRNQVRGAALPPTGNTGSGYTPGDTSVTTGKIADGAVTIPKLSFDPATQTELDAEASTRAAADTALAAPQYLTLALSGTLANERRLVAGTGISITDGGANGDATIASSGMTNPMTTQDDIIVGGAAGAPARLAKGSDSQVLTVDPSTHHLVWATPTSGGAPTGATYITQTHDSTLSAEQALADLATGILKSTTGTGVVSIATGADLPPMVASGASHSAGAVPDPGASSGTTRFLREDATWQTTSGGGGNVTSTGAVGSEPGSPSAGDLYLPNNGFVAERYSGSAWDAWGPIYPLPTPPTSGWSWANQGSATIDTTNGGMYLEAPAAGGHSFHMRLRTPPSTPYTITAALLPNCVGQDTAWYGVCWRESGSGKIVSFAILWSGGPNFSVSKMSDATTFNSHYTSNAIRAMPALTMAFFRIADNGTNRICSWSMDGQHFMQYHSVGRTDFITPDQIGFFVSPNNGTFPLGLTVLGWG